jgi:hypothetical protein
MMGWLIVRLNVRQTMLKNPELIDLIGGGGRTRTYDLRIMRFSFLPLAVFSPT